VKVAELFEAKITKPFGNAYYKPKYDSETGHMYGHQRDWMTLGDISQEDLEKAIEIVKQSDVFKNIESEGLKYDPKPKREKNGSLYFEVTRRLKGDDEKLLKDYKVGSTKTSIIKAALKALKGDSRYGYGGGPSVAQHIIDAARRQGHDFPEFKTIEKSIGTQPISRVKSQTYTAYYIVYPNGQIRTSSDGSKAYARLKSLKPRMVPGDPVKSLVKTYLAGINRMLEIWRKSRDKNSQGIPRLAARNP